GLKALASESQASLAGQTIGAYRIERLLGRGGMGEVYLAEDLRLERPVALKFLARRLAADSWARRRLIREAQAVARLDHPNICAVFGLEEADEHSFIVMQYVEGETLAVRLRQRPPVPAQALRFAEQIVRAIAEAHAHGLIHRDIKPQNVIVSDNEQLKVLDFGLAKSVEQTRDLAAGDVANQISQNGLVIGTIGYMSPEQLRAERLDFRSDVFSLGTLLYELFAGENPFARASGAETISAILTVQPPPLRNLASGVSTGLERLIHKCLEKDRTARFHSATELLYELSLLEQKNTPRWQPRRYLNQAAFLAFLALMALPAFVYFRSPSSPQPLATNVSSLSPAAMHTLAVLPIAIERAGENVGQEVEYLAHGLTESLIGKLSALPDLQVKAFTSVAGYKDKPLVPQTIGQELNVDTLLLGKLLWRRTGWALQTELVSVKDGTRIWSTERALQLDQVLDLQDDIAKSVIANLRLRTEGESNLLAHRGTTNPQAFRQYMLGRYYWRNRTDKNIHDAIHHFTKAIEIDPLYAQAHAGLADSYVLLSTVSFGKTPTEEAMSKAIAAAKDALSLNDNLPEAHTALGVVNLRYDWEWQQAEKEFQRAIALKPDYAPAHYWYSSLLIILGRRDEAIAESELAKKLDPFSAPSVMNVCRTLSLSRQYDRAIACYDKLLQEKPDYDHAKYLRGLVYQRSERTEEALAIFQTLYQKNPALAGAALGYAYGKQGKMKEARQVLTEMEALSKRRYIPPQEFAIIYIGLGDHDNAFRYLDQAYQEHFPTLAYIAIDPIFANLRADARYTTLVARLKLPSPAA
ncbi:MAG: protein kinase, partial [Acidobacteria bacterium]|nr:protein kinase [Acidobacteriota bacterium]